MNITSKILGGLALSFISLAACGGSDGSGVDGDKAIVSMSSSERTDFCEWAIEEQGGPGTVTMCGDVTITVQTVAACVASFDSFVSSCTATVAQGETCVEAIASNPCEFGGTACTPVFACQPE